MKKWILIITFIMFSCASSTEETLDIQLPEQTDDGWKVSSLQAENIDAKKINEILNLIETNPLYKNIHSLSIARNGKLVLDHYFSDRFRDQHGDPYSKTSLHTTQSVTKSFSSTIIGILIDQGKISGVDASIKSLLPEAYHIDWSGGKDKITLHHALTMGIGMEGDDSARAISENYSEYFYNNALEYQPGTVFEYRTAITNTFRDIIATAIQSETIENFMNEVLFQPLEIKDIGWRYRNVNNQIHTGGGLDLASRDMIKLGQLFLHKGVWNGNRVVSESWIKQATERYFDASDLTWAHTEIKLDGYGYQWWINDFMVDGKTIHAYQASGHGGQYIVVVPSRNTVVGFTSWYEDDKDFVHPLNLVEHHILKAIK